ncbi:MAG TPA: LysR family transcriptional regulator [Dongiaceae bacterium]|nr:LysR family transcriptional regulator [Dongiaceae bacterium]
MFDAHMFDWEDLHHFAVFAREKSLSAAARRLAVDHATVARRIAALESSLDLKLVDRRARAYDLTADGRRVAAIAERMDDDAFALGRAARSLQAGLDGEVAVSAPPALACSLIAARLGRLRAAHPRLTLRLIGEKRAASLSRREADLAVRLSRPTEGGLITRKIGSLAFALYATPDHLAAAPAAGHSFIAGDRDFDELPQQRWVKAVAGDRPVVLQANDQLSQLAAAKAGIGVAALPVYLGDAEPGLQRIAAKPATISRDIWLVVHRDLQKSPPVRAVMDFLTDCMESLPH